jgi:hypothetical protein
MPCYNMGMARGDACTVPGCDGIQKTRGWCQAHYMRWWATGVVGTADVVRRPKGRVCSLDGCRRPHSGRGFCDPHLRRFVKYGDPGPAEIEPRNPGAECSIEGCGKPVGGRGWCEAHYQRWRKTGDPLTPLPEHGAGWVGDAVTYMGLHSRLRSQRGKASDHTCVWCGEGADHWAYDHTDPTPMFGPKDQPYSADVNRYQPMCKTCHRRMDADRTRVQGCSVDGCDAEHKAGGLCNKHYQRSRALR